MDAEAILIPIAGMVFVAGLVGLVTGLFGQWISNRTLRDALKSNPENLAIMADKLHMRRPWNTELWGLVGMATGAALAVAALIGAPETRTLLLQTSLLPGFIGAALFGQRWLPKPGNAPAIESNPAE
jgi:uncharacterized protein YneF (UPF0154 family)